MEQKWGYTQNRHILDKICMKKWHYHRCKKWNKEMLVKFNAVLPPVFSIPIPWWVFLMLGSKSDYCYITGWGRTTIEVCQKRLIRSHDTVPNSQALPSVLHSSNYSLWGTFTKLWKATSFNMSVCLSIRMEQHGSHWTDFHEIWCWNIFQKPVDSAHDSLQSAKNNGYFT